ncbi:hypothetical protein ASG48_17555 [Aurantimonas sp. Leaf443]|nr:hypothetical protein ASG48_17555 [Aurantimonas sp. Leaf443]
MEDAVRTRDARRLAAAALRGRILAGGELATAEQLLRGYPFACGDMVKDSKDFALILAEWADGLPGRPLEDRLRPAIRALEGDCTLSTVSALADALAAAGRLEFHPELVGGYLRCRIYMAHLGSEDAAASVAADAITIASVQDWEHEQDALDIVWQSLGWLLHIARLRTPKEPGTTLNEAPLSASAAVRRNAGMFEVRVRRFAAEALEQPIVSNGAQLARGGIA